MSLDVKTVDYIAHLARLTLNDDKKSEIQQDLNEIMKVVSQISSANTDGISPMAHSMEVSQRLRKDVVTETNQRDELLKLTNQTESGLYLVPNILED